MLDNTVLVQFGIYAVSISTVGNRLNRGVSKEVGIAGMVRGAAPAFVAVGRRCFFLAKFFWRDLPFRSRKFGTR